MPDRADTWTRMVYAGANKPVAPIDDPYQMFAKLYGRTKDRETLKSVLDELQDDLKKVEPLVSAEDRRLLEEHATFVREMEQELKRRRHDVGHAVPELEPGVKEENDNMPQISKMQIELMVNSFAADFARVATLQITNSVGGARMRWLGIDEGHHELSHEPDSNEKSQDKLTRINKWYCEQFAYLAQRLAETPEPGGEGSLLDNTLIVWTNELGKGNCHTLDNIPFVLVGNGLDFQMGRSLKYQQRAAQPPAALAGPRLRPPHRAVRQPRLLRRRPAERVDGVEPRRLRRNAELLPQDIAQHCLQFCVLLTARLQWKQAIVQRADANRQQPHFSQVGLRDAGASRDERLLRQAAENIAWAARPDGGDARGKRRHQIVLNKFIPTPSAGAHQVIAHAAAPRLPAQGDPRVGSEHHHGDHGQRHQRHNQRAEEDGNHDHNQRAKHRYGRVS